MSRWLLIGFLLLSLIACSKVENEDNQQEIIIAFYPIGQGIEFGQKYIKQIANLENGKGYGTELNGRIYIEVADGQLFAFFITQTTSFKSYYYLNVATTSGNGLLVESMLIPSCFEIKKIKKLDRKNQIEWEFELTLNDYGKELKLIISFGSSATGNGSFSFK